MVESASSGQSPPPVELGHLEPDGIAPSLFAMAERGAALRPATARALLGTVEIRFSQRFAAVRLRFGGDRQPVLESLLEDPAARGLLAEAGGSLVGYACLRTDTTRIGPVLADDPHIAETLLVHAFASAPAADELRLNLPPNNRPGAEWLRGLGVEIEPWDGRMGRGPQIARRDDTVYGMAVGALG